MASNDVDPAKREISPVVEDKRQHSSGGEAPNEQQHGDAAVIQAGVQKALILKKAWSRTTLGIAFGSLFLTTFVITLSDYAFRVLEPFVTSSFQSHSAMGAARVAGNISRIIAFPVIAKLSDVFGRAEMFMLSVLLQALSFALFAASQNIGDYIAAGLFDAIGSTGFIIVQQVFLADATNLVNRALWSTLPESITTIPALYLGTIVGEGFLNTTWRWGYGSWAIITPVVAVPLIATVLILQLRAKKHGLQVNTLSAVAGCSPDAPMWGKIFHLVWTEMDMLGLLLLVTGMALILIPLSLTGSFSPQRWKEASFIAMIVIGVVCLIAFLVWDLKFAKQPYIPWRMANRTVIAGCAIQVLDFWGYTLFTIFFPSYLQVAGEYSPGHATRIDNSLRVAFQICGLLVAVGMKYTKNSHYWLLGGPPLVIIGQGVMIYLVNMPDGGRASEAAFIASKVVSGCGRAFYQTAAQVSVQAAVTRQDVAVVTGVFQAANSIGGAIGTSIAGTIWRNTLPSKLESFLPDENKSDALSIFQNIKAAMAYPSGSPARVAINQSYSQSQMILAIVSTAVSAPNLIIMFFMKNIKLDEEDEKDEKSTEQVIAEIEQQGNGRQGV